MAEQKKLDKQARRRRHCSKCRKKHVRGCDVKRRKQKWAVVAIGYCERSYAVAKFLYDKDAYLFAKAVTEREQVNPVKHMYVIRRDGMAERIT